MPESQFKTKRKVHRSPNYPSLSLSDAVERARRVYDAEKRTPAGVDTILAHLGYKPGAGPGYRSLSALRHYGLLEEHSGQERISDAAFHILTLSETSQDRQQAIREAALQPTLFRQVWDHYKGQVPSDLNLRDYLIKTHSFNPDSVPSFIKAFRDTVEFAKLTPEEHNSSVETQSTEQLEMESSQQSNSKISTPKLVSGERELTTGLLSKYASFRLIVSGNVGVKEIERLIAKLQLDKEILADPDGGDSGNGE